MCVCVCVCGVYVQVRDTSCGSLASRARRVLELDRYDLHLDPGAAPKPVRRPNTLRQFAARDVCDRLGITLCNTRRFAFVFVFARQSELRRTRVHRGRRGTGLENGRACGRGIPKPAARLRIALADASSCARHTIWPRHAL